MIYAEIIGVTGIGSIRPGADLGDLIVSRIPLVDGDVVVISAETANEVQRAPQDPDAAARQIRDRIAELRGVKVAVVLSEAETRTSRRGSVGIGVGAAGISALREVRARVTGEAPNRLVADVDAVAAAAELIKGAASATPAAVIRGLSYYVDDEGASQLAQPASEQSGGQA